MLTSIRNKSTSFVAKVLFGLLIVAFALWGIGDIFSGDQAQKPVATIGSVKYSQAEFRRDLKQAMDRFAQQMQGMQFTAQQFAQFGGVAQVVAQAINRNSLKVYAQEHGLSVSQATAVAEIQADPQFQNATRQFDRNRFVLALDQLGLSESGYVAEVQSDLVNQALYRAILTGITVPKPMAAELYLYQAEERAADVLVIPNASMKDIPAPDDAALEAYRKEHADAYKAPEYRAATVLTVAPEDLVGEVTVTDDEIAQEYEAQKANFSTPDIREVEQVVVQDQAQADKIEEAVKGGAAFADAVKQVTGGDPVALGKVTKEKLPAEIADGVFAVAAGGVSAPLKSPFGIHVVHVISSEPATTKTLDEMKVQLKHNIALAKATEALDSIIKQLDDTLAGGASLDEAGAKLKMKVAKVAAVDTAGKDEKGADTGLKPDVVQLIFSTDAGNQSSVTPFNDGSYAVVQTTSTTPPADKPFDQVKEQLKSDWLAEKQHEAAQAKAKEIAEKAKTGDLQAEATALGLTVKQSPAFTRDKGDPLNDITPSLAASLFAVKQGETAVGDSKDGPVVAKVTGITPPDPAAHPDDVATLTQAVNNQIRGDLAAQFSAALQQEIKPVVHEDVINSLIAE
ncbi:peptidyl-prolyl cis-trans isomerase [Dongia sedimenti]|uniref:Parvulin-like PPIase n=1 Tax=Dongia sedimenti TaxID=3064282 RepID=A0ABU0YK07_9PROT|nr:SurA N-terminal domain-containing protein [Rhodospirillaceae bacterium R-7]